MEVMNYLRRAADSSPLRQYLLRPEVRSAMARVASVRFLRGLAAIEQPGAFLRKVATKQNGLVRVQLRDSPVTMFLAANAESLELLYEIFAERCYEVSVPPRNFGNTSGPKVLDVGANTGVFAAYVLSRWPNASITCVEPDPTNLQALRTCRESNPGSDITIVEAAATTFDGVVNFRGGLGSGSLISDEGEPTRAVDFFELAPGFDLVKMDIERGEWPILEDPRMQDLASMTWVMEYHRRYAGDQGAGDQATQYLERAGFTVDEIRPNYWGHGLLKARKN